MITINIFPFSFRWTNKENRYTIKPLKYNKNNKHWYITRHRDGLVMSVVYHYVPYSISICETGIIANGSLIHESLVGHDTWKDARDYALDWAKSYT